MTSCSTASGSGQFRPARLGNGTAAMATLALDSLLDGRYRLGPVVGRGASAEVREALDETSGEDVAIKFVAMDSPDARVRAASEIGALERLDHPNLLAARGHGEMDGYVYVVTDLVRGETLEARIHHERLSPAEVATIGTAVAAGLSHAHHLGVVHRDLKPANVLLGDDGTVRLADFGIARLVGQAGHTSSGLIRGSAPYLAPEQVEGGFISPATDVYALGLVVLEALTGERAFEGTPIESAQARLHRGPEIPSGLDDAWISLIADMTAREPGDRPTSAEVTDRLDRLADGSSSMPVVIAEDSAPTSIIAAADLATAAEAPDSRTSVFPAAAVAAAGTGAAAPKAQPGWAPWPRPLRPTWPPRHPTPSPNPNRRRQRCRPRRRP